MSAPVTEAHKQLVATIVEQAFRFAEGNHKITPLSQLIADSEARACDQLRAEVERLKDHAFDKDGTSWKTVCGWWSAKYNAAERQMSENAARAERAEAELERLRHLEALLNQAAAEVTAHTFTAGGIAGLRAENERLRRAYVRPDDIRAQLESAAARASLSETELRAELALLREWQREVIQNANAHHAEREDAIARAERAEAELHALRLICGTTDADKFSTWVDRANARAEKAEAELAKAKAVLASIEEDGTEEHNAAVRLRQELATERARLDWLEGNAGDIPRYNSRSWIWIAHQNLREKIDAAMKEETK